MLSFTHGGALQRSLETTALDLEESLGFPIQTVRRDLVLLAGRPGELNQGQDGKSTQGTSPGGLR